LLPADRCVICQKTLKEVGGQRIIAQQVRGVCLSKKFRGGGDKNFPYKSFKISPYPIFLTVWGELSMWNEGAVKRAMDAFSKGKRPWFCQVCGNRICPECGFPLKMPVGSDVLYDDGSSSHVPMLPCNPGCINPNCSTKKEKE
jgi:hypothetical protein